MTTKLYFDQPLQMTFQATVLSCTPQAASTDLYDIILDQTCFYPTGGGQSCDQGHFNQSIAVLDVRKEGETVIHTTQTALEPNSSVTGNVDEAHRHGNMQAHTGQHILSAAFLAELNAETLAVKMNPTGLSTVDVSQADLITEQIAQVEQLANRIIMENRPVHSTFVPPESPRLNALRRAVKFDKVSGDVRLVEIADFDLAACAGTHMPTTGMLGMLKIVSVVNYKGGSRVSFAVGWEALRQFQHYHRTLDAVAHDLSSSTEAVPDRVAQLQTERTALSKEADSLRQDLLAYEADDLYTAGEIITQTFVDRSADDLRTLANLLTEKGSPLVVFASSVDSDTTLIVATSADSEYHAGDTLKSLLALFDGRGGGRDSYAQGILKNFTDTDALLAAISDVV